MVTVDVQAFTYDGSDHPALTDISLKIERGQWISIVGPSGSGKSTLCGLIAGVLQRMSNDIDGEVTGLPYDQHGQVGLVFQDPDLGLIHSHVEDELSFAPENLRVPAAEIKQRMRQALAAVGLPEDMLQRKTAQLSGGQKQRIAIAAILTMQPTLLILDESTVHLDDEGMNQLYETIRSLHKQGHTIVTTSARWEDEANADQVIILDQGRMVSAGSPEQVQLTELPRLQELGIIPLADSLQEPTSAPHEIRMAAAVKATAEAQVNSAESKPSVEVEELTFTYEGSEQPVFEQLSFQLPQHALLAVLGPNGAGKTTLGRLLVGLAPYKHGSIKVRDQEISELPIPQLAHKAGYIFQNPDHQFVANTVWEECKFGNDESDERVLQLLEHFSLADVQDENPYQLNVFQKRKLNLLAASLNKPELIVLDEPTAGLNYNEAAELVTYCAQLAEAGTAIVFITHDIWAIQQQATHILRMTAENLHSCVDGIN